jgi:hypothetical protein
MDIERTHRDEEVRSTRDGGYKTSRRFMATSCKAEEERPTLRILYGFAVCRRTPYFQAFKRR